MAMDQSALLELLEALKAADVSDRIRLATQVGAGTSKFFKLSQVV